jgi:hypothetical protein
MVDGFHVDVPQLRAHAGNIDAVKARFGAVKSASTHIAQDDRAYGFLCGWISAILEDKHRKQDELIAYVEESLGIVSEELHSAAEDYTAMDNTATDRIKAAGVVEGQ